VWCGEAVASRLASSSRSDQAEPGPGAIEIALAGGLFFKRGGVPLAGGGFRSPFRSGVDIFREGGVGGQHGEPVVDHFGEPGIDENAPGALRGFQPQYANSQSAEQRSAIAQDPDLTIGCGNRGRDRSRVEHAALGRQNGTLEGFVRHDATTCR
jgi:hypothetical protein